VVTGRRGALVTGLLATAHGVDLEVLRAGSGRPVTVFAHGLAGTIADTRPLASGVPGTRVFLAFRGHGRSTGPPPGSAGWTYASLAADLGAVADAAGATRAVAVSMGAGALCRLLATRPYRFDRAVLFLPAVLDQPHPPDALGRLAALADAVDSGEPDAIAAVVIHEVPPAYRNSAAAQAFVRERVAGLVGTAVAGALRALPGQVAVGPEVGGAAALRRVTAPVLVIGCAGDPRHPVGVAERVAAAFPNGRLHLYDEPAVLWTHRADLRTRICSFLAE